MKRNFETCNVNHCEHEVFAERLCLKHYNRYDSLRKYTGSKLERELSRIITRRNAWSILEFYTGLSDEWILDMYDYYYPCFTIHLERLVKCQPQLKPETIAIIRDRMDSNPGDYDEY